MGGARFDRQVRFAPLGERGQARIEGASVLIVGCGALGGSLAMAMVRSGVGRVVLVDRDVVELSNLPRQVLFGSTTSAGRRSRPRARRSRASADPRASSPTRCTSTGATWPSSRTAAA